jgi:hypothetical protein
LSAEEESEYESLAVRNAIRMAADTPSGVVGKELIGNLAWGNGSVQGRITEKAGMTYAPVGLKTLKTCLVERLEKGLYPGVEIVGEGRKQKVFFDSAKSFESVMTGLRTVLLERLPKDM